MRRVLISLLFLLSFAGSALAIDNPTKGYGPADASGDPANQAASVSPSDTSDLSFVSTTLWVGAAGNITVVMANDFTPGMSSSAASSVAVTFTGVQAGTWLPLRVGRVMNTGTTASGIVEVRK